MANQFESAKAVAQQVRTRERSATEVVADALARIEAAGPSLNAFTSVDADRALAEAADLDRRLAAGEEPPPLAGVPLAVKDLEDAAGFTTTFGSLLHVDDAPASADSELVARLRRGGCIVVGKTNTPELGFKSDTDNRPFGATYNPWGDGARSAGGSSGGAASALAAGLVPLATGSDAGGSIRIPASVCGITGFKPSSGRVPATTGPAPGQPDLSVRAPMARTAAEAATAMDLVVGPHSHDLRSLDAPGGSFIAAAEAAALPTRVAWSATMGYANVDSEVARVCALAVGKLADAGVDLVEVDAPLGENPVMAWFTINMVNTYRRVAHLVGTDLWELLDPDLASWLGWASGVSALDLLAAQDQCQVLAARLADVHDQFDLLVTPTVAGQTGLAGGDGTIDGAPDVGWVSFTYPFNLTRSPVGTVCAGHVPSGMPVGLQFVGPQRADLAVVSALAAAEGVLGLAGPPPGWG